MHERERDGDTPSYEAIVIGAGICGVVFLKYARDRGLRCVALEKQDEVGGLWARLPSWQDIQNRKADFALNDVPLEGVSQPAVHRYIREWVRRYGLGPHIELGCEVTSASWTGERWRVQTNRGAREADYLIVATGVQNAPWIPDVDRSGSDLPELHSSALGRPENLAGKGVTIVGGGTSSWDLLEQAMANGATDIHWVYRSLRWFQPTRRTKQKLWPNLREMAVLQSLGLPHDKLSAFLGWMFRTLYRRFGVTELQPAEPFDLTRHQAVPGRRRMLRHLDRIHRHRTEVEGVRGREVSLANGERFETDVVLWATGYRMDLEYLGLPEYRDIHRVQELAPRLGSLVRSNDYPDLFFVGMTLVNGTSSTPFFAAVEAKTIVAHILGECEVPEANVPDMIVHWALFPHFASFDPSNYPPVWWRIKSFFLALWYLVAHDRALRI